MLCRSSGRRFFPETVLSETTSSNLPQSRLPGRQNFWQHLTVTEKRLQPIFMSASVGMQRGLSLSLLQQRLTPKLLPPRISLWISRRQHPTPVPSFTNIRKPRPRSGWFRSNATVAFIFRRYPERSERPLICSSSSRCPRSSCFSCCHPRRKSTHKQPSREPPEKSHYTRP
jgi:hypothetical protein